MFWQFWGLRFGLRSFKNPRIKNFRKNSKFFVLIISSQNAPVLTNSSIRWKPIMLQILSWNYWVAFADCMLRLLPIQNGRCKFNIADCICKWNICNMLFQIANQIACKCKVASAIFSFDHLQFRKLQICCVILTLKMLKKTELQFA